METSEDLPVENSKTVLVVDDSRMARIMITKIIHSHHPEWETLDAKTAEEALQVSEGRSIDIMTLDMNMPGMDGLKLDAEMCKRFPDGTDGQYARDCSRRQAIR